MALLAGNGYLCGAQIEAVIQLNNPSYVPQRSVPFAASKFIGQDLMGAETCVGSFLLLSRVLGLIQIPRSFILTPEFTTAGKVPSFSGRPYW